MTNNPTAASILLVEDDVKLANLTFEYLRNHQFAVEHTANGLDAIDRVKSTPPDLLILDLNLPGADGLEVCRTVRPFFNAPILMFTARDEDIDQILGLEIGADDYVTKPVPPRLLLARINALLRRKNSLQKSSADANQQPLHHGHLSINLNAREVYWHKRPLTLTTNEFELLSLFARNAGQVLSRDDISKAVRGIEFDGLDRWVDIQVSRLRARFDDETETAKKFKTVWGKGYLFVSEAWQE